MKIINYNETPPKNINSEFQVYSSSNNMNDSMKKTLNNRSIHFSRVENPVSEELPFSKAINLLKTIVNYKVPFEKMMLISTISLEITECVNEFWKEYEYVIEPNNLNIDADELMSIFIYIMIKSELYDLFVHLRLIRDFTTSSSKSTMVGYYYVTLEASIMYILEIKNINDLKKKKTSSMIEVQDDYKQNLGSPNKQSVLDDSSLAINNMNAN